MHSQISLIAKETFAIALPYSLVHTITQNIIFAHTADFLLVLHLYRSIYSDQRSSINLFSDKGFQILLSTGKMSQLGHGILSENFLIKNLNVMFGTKFYPRICSGEVLL